MNSFSVENWRKKDPLFSEILSLKPVVRLNPDRHHFHDLPALPFTIEDMRNAQALLKRFAPFLKKAFPEIKLTDDLLESPLRAIPHFQKRMEDFGEKISGKFFLKCDNELPVAGSIKARGGFYEVLHFAEELAIKNKIIHPDENYEVFTSQKVKSFFNQYIIGVGSTGNLGLSIGIMSAQLGFQVNVFMSADAKDWKKKLLRSKGANVVEFSGDFGEAITAGRATTLATPNGYFVDDEKSQHLFLGYSLAAFEVQKQLEQQSILVDEEHPLFVYLPCGVGGSPGGITFGLKQIYGDNVHCFFVEPTHSPAVLVGMLTGLMEKISVHDIGIDNITEADGLAVARPSAFATPISQLLISGNYTIEDETLYRLLYLLKETENIKVEPSATAGLIGPQVISKTDYLSKKINPKNITHLAWATGGLLIPDDDYEQFYKKGFDLLKRNNGFEEIATHSVLMNS